MKEQEKKTEEKTFGKTRLYTILGLLAVVLAIAIVITSVALAKRQSSLQLNNGNGNTSFVDEPTEPIDDPEPVKPVVVDEGFVNPVSVASVINQYGFYYNGTLKNYYMHTGIDFSAAVGDEVYATEAGTVEEVSVSDVLVGTRVVIDHGKGVKSVYEFVDAVEGLKAGDKVKKGDCIARVAEPTGNEYKDGAHLHFEIFENDEAVDPTKFLTMEEK